MDVDLEFTHVVSIEDLPIIKNLETAFQEEIRSSINYVAYAVKADEEGYHGIASLFRATARAEQIHASNHARVLRYMGGSTMFDVPEPRVEHTLENLKSALVDQKFEVDYLYPTFLITAVPLFDSTAIRTFHWAHEADKAHVRLFGDVSARVNANGSSEWAHERHSFYVCALCGYAALETNGENCPACNFLSEKFETVD